MKTKTFDCGHPVVTTAFGTPQCGTDKDGKTSCYVCCHEAEKKFITEAEPGDKAVFYMSQDGTEIQTWTGQFLMSVITRGAEHPWSTRLNGRRYITTRDLDGNCWHGVGAPGEYCPLTKNTYKYQMQHVRFGHVGSTLHAEAARVARENCIGFAKTGKEPKAHVTVSKDFWGAGSDDIVVYHWRTEIARLHPDGTWTVTPYMTPTSRQALSPFAPVCRIQSSKIPQWARKKGYELIVWGYDYKPVYVTPSFTMTEDGLPVGLPVIQHTLDTLTKSDVPEVRIIAEVLMRDGLNARAAVARARVCV